MEKIRIMVADDYPVLREGLSKLLESEADFSIVAKACDGYEAVSIAEQYKPDVAIIDVMMPNLSGIEAAKQIKTANPGTAIIMFSCDDYEAYIYESLKAGAVGYILKNSDIKDVIGAIRAVKAGKTVFEYSSIEGFLRRLHHNGHSSESNFEILHKREIEIITLVAKGLNNKEICEKLFISAHTVQAHLENIFRKLKAKSRAQAIVCALKKGWLVVNDL